MTTAIKLLFLALAPAAALLSPVSRASSQPEFRPSAEAIRHAVWMAHARAEEAGGRPGPRPGG